MTKTTTEPEPCGRCGGDPRDCRCYWTEEDERQAEEDNREEGRAFAIDLAREGY